MCVRPGPLGQKIRTVVAPHRSYQNVQLQPPPRGAYAFSIRLHTGRAVDRSGIRPPFLPSDGSMNRCGQVIPSGGSNSGDLLRSLCSHQLMPYSIKHTEILVNGGSSCRWLQ
jgi:hypothetical protein